MNVNTEAFDVLVVGAGNAGLCAAIAAREQGARVLVVEKAPIALRGGNSSLTMNFRFPHRTPQQLLSLIDDVDHEAAQTVDLVGNYVPYEEAAFAGDLMRLSKDEAERQLVATLARGAWETIRWLRGLGHRWEYKPTALAGSVPIRLKGGGAALQRQSFAVAERLGVKFLYGCSLQALETRGGAVVGARLSTENGVATQLARSVVLACGGYQADPHLRRKHLGALWEDIALRGVPFNTGDGHRAAYAVGAAEHGDFSHCHATPQDSRLKRHMLPGENEESQSRSRYAFNYGVTVNFAGERFFDEGQDLPNYVYAKFGASILRQPKKTVFQIFDSRTACLLPKAYFSSRNMFRAPTLKGLAVGLGIRADRFVETMRAFNEGASSLPSQLRGLDGLATVGVSPPKSNWATKIDQPPFYGCPVRAGLTFTYGGLRIDPVARVLTPAGEPVSNLYAAGEIVGGIFVRNYAGGSGLMSGSHFGRLAGLSATCGGTA